MNALIRKTLSYLLIALLALAPLQPIMADLGKSDQHGMASCHSDMGHDLQHDSAPTSSMDCAHCDMTQLCDDNCCSAGVCGSAAIALVPFVASLQHSISPRHDIHYLEAKLPSFSHGPFRPPRA